MKDKGRGLGSVIAVVLIAVAALWVLYAVWRSPHRSDLATYGAFAVAVVVSALGWITWTWRARAKKVEQATGGRELNHRADLLAEAVRRQWQQAADERGLLTPKPIPVRWGRPTLRLAVSADAATGSQRFDPLPGVTPVSEMQLTAGQVGDLHAVYGGLGSGRLVIAGAPGSGKSGAAVLLILTALKHREQVADADRPQVPVPVLFTAQDWDPVSQLIGDWLAERMRQAYLLFSGKAGAADAAALVAAGKVALILDGLDEVAENLRPVALRALSRQAAFRTIVLSRTAEMASAASRQGILEGAAAVELHAIDPDTAADYLSRVQLDPAPDGWRDLISRIRSQGSPLAQALDNPLALTLVRDTYRAGDDVRELLEFCDAAQQRVSGCLLVEDITGHLLDRVLPAAYERRPGERVLPYDLQTAQHSLTKIAAQMNQDRSRDLQWWQIPKWAPVAPRILGGIFVGGLVGVLVGGLTFGLMFGLMFGLLDGLLGGLVLGLICGLGGIFVGGFVVGFAGLISADTPQRIGKFQLRRALSRMSLEVGLVGGLVGGVLGGLLAGVGVGVKAAVAVGLLCAVVSGLEDTLAAPDNTSSLSPLASWRADRRYALVGGLALGLLAGLGSWLVDGVLAAGLALGLLVGLVIIVGSSSAWSSSLASAQLARRWHTPVRIMRFLDDARERGVLRTVGPVYQFRHARLQDRLAEQDNSPP